MDRRTTGFRLLGMVTLLSFASMIAAAQVDDVCGEFGHMATLDAPRLSAPYIYGRIRVSNGESAVSLPKVSITYSNRSQTPERITVGRTGNYCFKIANRGDGMLIVDVDGVEVARRQVSSFGPAQIREDFEISLNSERPATAPGVVSSKYYRPPNTKTAELYRQAATAESQRDLAKATELLESIVAVDPSDYNAWGLLASMHLQRDSFTAAEASVRKALEIRVDYAPAWLTAGRIRLAQGQHLAAIEVLKHASTLEPVNPAIFQLLGEAYLLSKQGTLGAEALNKAIELDPIGMAACHLQLAHLYQLAKANKLAAEEYKQFLAKVPDHPEKDRLQKFIAEHQ